MSNFIIGKEIKFKVDVPDYTSARTISCMKYGNYYERFDFELLDWNSTLDIVCNEYTLDLLLKLIWDKYPIMTLSFILRKSIKQIQFRLQELGLKSFNENENTEIMKQIQGNIINNDNEIILSVYQSEKFELEHWFHQNNNYQDFKNNQINLQNIYFKETIDYYIKNKQYDLLFKFMVIVFNFLRIPYQIKSEELKIVFTFNKGIKSKLIEQSYNIIDIVDKKLIGVGSNGLYRIN